MEQPGAFFLWLAVCGLVAWRTAFQMPDGFGNAIFACQLAVAAISSVLMAMYLPSAINPNLAVSSGSGTRTITIPRARALRGVAIAIVVFLVGNIGGYMLDRRMGLPERYADDAVPGIAAWVSKEPALATCLTTVWSPATSCTLVVDVSQPEQPAHYQLVNVSLVDARCPSTYGAALETCAREGLARGTIMLPHALVDSFVYAGHTRVAITTMLVGSGPPPPVERGP